MGKYYSIKKYEIGTILPCYNIALKHKELEYCCWYYHSCWAYEDGHKSWWEKIITACRLVYKDECWINCNDKGEKFGYYSDKNLLHVRQYSGSMLNHYINGELVDTINLVPWNYDVPYVVYVFPDYKNYHGVS